MNNNTVCIIEVFQWVYDFIASKHLICIAILYTSKVTFLGERDHEWKRFKRPVLGPWYPTYGMLWKAGEIWSKHFYTFMYIFSLTHTFLPISINWDWSFKRVTGDEERQLNTIVHEKNPEPGHGSVEHRMIMNSSPPKLHETLFPQKTRTGDGTQWQSACLAQKTWVEQTTPRRSCPADSCI